MEGESISKGKGWGDGTSQLTRLTHVPLYAFEVPGEPGQKVLAWSISLRYALLAGNVCETRDSRERKAPWLPVAPPLVEPSWLLGERP